MRLGEALFFVCLATSLHAAVWHASPSLTGAKASGGSGPDSVSIQAASAVQQAMVDEWQRPPVVATDVPSVLTPQKIAEKSPTTTPLAPPVISSDMPRLSALAAPPPPPEVDETPAIIASVIRPRMRPPLPPVRAVNQPSRQASGTARHADSGASGSAQAQTTATTAKRTNALKVTWGAHIHKQVSRHVRYPRGTTEKGSTTLTLTLAPSGSLKDVRLARSSGDARLDQAAFDAVKRAGHFAQAPEGLAEPKYLFNLALTFEPPQR